MDALADIRSTGNHKLWTLMEAMKQSLGGNALMAYLAMMALRLCTSRSSLAELQATVGMS